MCVVSMIGDHYNEKWKPYHKIINDGIQDFTSYFPPVSRAEFDALKKEVENMKELLKKAKIYDEKTGQPDCEIDEKIEFLKKMAKVFDINLDDILKKKNEQNPK